MLPTLFIVDVICCIYYSIYVFSFLRIAGFFFASLLFVSCLISEMTRSHYVTRFESSFEGRLAFDNGSDFGLFLNTIESTYVKVHKNRGRSLINLFGRLTFVDSIRNVIEILFFYYIRLM